MSFDPFSLAQTDPRPSTLPPAWVLCARRRLVLLGEQLHGEEGEQESRACRGGGDSWSRGATRSRSRTYQPVEEVGHLHLGEVGRFDLWLLMRFG